jgi:hypothetical protein
LGAFVNENCLVFLLKTWNMFKWIYICHQSYVFVLEMSFSK